MQDFILGLANKKGTVSNKEIKNPGNKMNYHLT